MSQLSKLKSAKTLHDVADLLSFRPSSVSYILYKKPADKKYKKFEIPKKTGGFRQICAPLDDLKLLQSRLAELLQNCQEEIDKTYKRSDDDLRPDRITHGFKRRRSIITNAREHRNRRYVFNVDLENFFGTINFGRVRGFLMKNKNFALDAKVATILTQIACFDDVLPQGSPCSPVISNLITHILDIQLAKLAAETGCSYSRYADDLTFSTNKSDFPPSVAARIDTNEHLWVPGDRLTQLIRRAGFEIKPEKTRMQYRDSRQEVTGLVVNNKLNVRSEYRHLVRAMVHSLFTKGSFQLDHEVTDLAGKVSLQKVPGSLNQLHGMLGFIDGVDLYNKKINSTTPDGKLISSKERMYRRFLMFKELYAAQEPVLICEGKTDYVYITHALRSLATAFPTLATKKANGTIDFKFRRLKYAGTSTGRILGLHGGAPALGNFIFDYRSEVKRFKAPGMQNPVILLIDNDDGAQRIYSIAKEITGIKPTGVEPFVYLFANLYLVATPLGNAKKTQIEDFFPPDIKNTLLFGKRFDPSNDHETSTHYGKADFAYKVVTPNADKINFTAFQVIFDNVISLIEEHAKKLATKTLIS